MKTRIKKKFLEALKRNKSIFETCDEFNIARATYYRWLKDIEFATEAEAAIDCRKTLQIRKIYNALFLLEISREGLKQYSLKARIGMFFARLLGIIEIKIIK